MIPGFTASSLLDRRPPGAVSGRREFARARVRASATPQERTTLDRGGDTLSWGSHDPPVVCACPCCMTHSCGFLGLSTCLTCC